MPTVTLSRKVVEKLMGTRLSDKKLKDRISMLGTDLEDIKGDDINVEIFPNRPDMLSEQGFARALSSFIGKKTGLQKFTVKKGIKDYWVEIKPSVKKVRPHTVCAIIKKLEFDDEKIREIIQIQEKLHISIGRNRKKLAIGIYPLEEIKMPITYTAKKPKDIKFIPLETNREMDGLQILSRHPAGRDYGFLLEGKELFPVFIDANKEVMSMPPIINSEKTGKVSENTTDVFIECSGHDLKSLNQCLNILVTAMYDMGGEIYEITIKDGKKTYKTPDLKPKKMKLDVQYLNKMTGMDMTKKQIGQELIKMGYGVEKNHVLVPAYRTDILHPIDLAEDVAIAYGYENFKPEIPNVSTTGEEQPIEILKRKVADILTGLGLTETISYHLISKENHNDKMCLEEKGFVELLNSSTKEYAILRKSVMPSLMQILSRNTNKEYPQKIFEIGNVFQKDTREETNVKESYKLGVAICDPGSDFTKIKQVLDAVMDALDVKYESEECVHTSFIKGRNAKISINKKEVGIMGEIHPEVITNFGIEMPISMLELDLKEISDEVM